MHDGPVINHQCFHMKSCCWQFECHGYMNIDSFMGWITNLSLQHLDSTIQVALLLWSIEEGLCIMKKTLDLEALLRESPCVSFTEYQLWNYWFSTVQIKYFQWDAWETGKMWIWNTNIIGGVKRKKSYVGLFHMDSKFTWVWVFRNVASSYERFSKIHYNTVYNCWLIIRNTLTWWPSYLPKKLVSFALTGAYFDVFFLQIHCKLQTRHFWISSEIREECSSLRISRSWFPTAPYPRVRHLITVSDRSLMQWVLCTLRVGCIWTGLKGNISC